MNLDTRVVNILSLIPLLSPHPGTTLKIQLPHLTCDSSNIVYLIFLSNVIKLIIMEKQVLNFVPTLMVIKILWKLILIISLHLNIYLLNHKMDNVKCILLTSSFTSLYNHWKFESKCILRLTRNTLESNKNPSILNGYTFYKNIN